MEAPSAKRARRCPPPPAASPRALDAFLGWCAGAGVELSAKVGLSCEGTVAEYGLLAQEDLGAGEVLFTIPRAALLSQHTCALSSLLEEEQESLRSPSGWVPLLISLLHESTISDSRWGPYLSLWPHFSGLDHPMFWDPEERERLLQGTGVLEAVQKDLADIETEYSTIILPFLKAHPEVFDPQVHTLELSRKLVAFIMAYSFQEPLEDEDDGEPNPPLMVPLADLLNHVANHNAHLEYSPESLRMVTTQPVCRGQEIFNTYGQLSNWQLLHMYGFAELYPGNTDDAAEIQMTTLLQAALEGASAEQGRQLVLDQWAFLCQQELVGEEGAFVIGWETILTEEELSAALQCHSDGEEAFGLRPLGWRPSRLVCCRSPARGAPRARSGHKVSVEEEVEHLPPWSSPRSKVAERSHPIALKQGWHQSFSALSFIGATVKTGLQRVLKGIFTLMAESLPLGTKDAFEGRLLGSL